MNRIPVWKTIAYAYNFTFGHLGTIIGLIWLPTLLITLASFFLGRTFSASMDEALANGLSPSGIAALGALLLQVAGLLVGAMNAVAVTREALGLRKPGAVLLHFALGPVEFRVLGAFLILAGLLLLFGLAYLIVVSVAGGIAMAMGGGAKAAGGLIVSVLAIAGFCALIYATVRLSFLAVPATVAEGRIGIIRGWQLAGGNFWRIFLIQLFTIMPLLLVVAGAEVAIIGLDALIPPLDALKDPAALQKFTTKESSAIQDHLPELMGLGFLAAPFMYGLFFSPSAIGYRALVPAGNGMQRT